MKTKSKMAVVRGVQPRMSEANFYSYFNHFQVKLIGDKKTGWIREKELPRNIQFTNLPLKPVWGFDPWTSFFGPLHAHRSFQFVQDLAKHLADCQVINISDLFYFYCWQSARIAAQERKTLVAIVWENVPHHLSTYLPPYCFGVQKVLRTADLFIARSQGARDYLLSIGVQEKKIRVIYKGIDLTTFVSQKRKPDGKVRILYVGQLVKTKGIGELLAAFEKLSQEFAHLELWLVGRSQGEPWEKRARKMAKRLPIVVRAGLAYHRLPALYQQADIYCHLSQDWRYLGLVAGGNEWFSYAILEAMASGLPVVATRVGGMPEQLGERSNLFVKQKDTQTVYQALKKLILDEKLRKKVGERNRKRAERLFEIKSQAKKTEEAILEII